MAEKKDDSTVDWQEPEIFSEDRLVEDLAAIIQRCAAHSFLTNPILQLTPSCFSDPWMANTSGVELLAARLMKYAGIEGLIPKVTKHVKLFQFYQDQSGHVVLKIVKANTYTDDDSLKILDALSKRYKNILVFEIQFVNDIPRTERGKHRFLIQKFPIKFGNS